MSPGSKSKRRGEQGQTIILVAVSIVSLLAMAALAIDVVTLYVAKSEIQRAADAAALAGAKAIADSGVTTLPNFGADAQGVAASMANAEINAILPVNTVAGRQPLLVSWPIDWTRQGNPIITVRLEQVNLPTFFARIWGRTATTVSASATAEAYNPSNNSSFTAIAPSSVKPWLVANLDPNTGAAIVDASNNAESGIVSTSFNLTADCPPLVPNCITPPTLPPGKGLDGGLDYLPAAVAPDPVNGPNVGPSYCPEPPYYERSIECADVITQYGCGTGGASWDNSVNPGGVSGLSAAGAECLINVYGAPSACGTPAATGSGNGQDSLGYPLPYPTGPPTIIAGQGLFAGSQVSTSSSIVTIPIFDRTAFNPISPSVNIVGFLQAFINYVQGGTGNNAGDINITVLNVAACNGTGNLPAVVGGSGTSPVPVRLITSP